LVDHRWSAKGRQARARWSAKGRQARARWSTKGRQARVETYLRKIPVESEYA
jgi:hypothetical protein